MADRPTARLAARHAVFDKDQSFTASDGTHIAFAVVNAGAPGVPVVFMNGWTCPDAYWKTIVPGVVGAGHPGIVFDTRGHAQSGLPRQPGLLGQKLRAEDLSVERLARDVIELLDAAAVRGAVLMGHSMGVQVLFEAYRLAPDRVAGLIPVAGTYENPVPTFANQPVLDRLFPIADVIFKRVPFVLLRPVLAQTAKFPNIGVRAVRLLHVANQTVTADDLAPHVAQFSELNMSVLWRIMSGMRGHSAADVLPP
jgi:pimeloyl-ACP methyl ester carboxylesterase